MGASGSRIEKSLGDSIPEDERYYGLENFGNTCYCNSVLQALFFCRPFRKCVLTHEDAVTAGTAPPDDLLACLAELFAHISGQKKRCGVVAPRKFIARLRKENEAFRGYMHQDAHEFLNYLLNTIAEVLVTAEKKKTRLPKAVNGASSIVSDGRARDVLESSSARGTLSRSPATTPDRPATAAVGGARIATDSMSNGACNGCEKPASVTSSGSEPVTWVHRLFEGVLTNETKCLCCESVSSKDESFLDLSVDIEQNTSITGCLRNFSSTETLCREHKYYCDVCGSLQEAQKRMRIKRLPPVLALHLKRFKYMEDLHRFRKLHHRVVFPHELRLFNTSDDAVDADRMYDLFAVVVHVGGGTNHGHYISVVKSHDHWLVFDDDNVELMQGSDLKSLFGLAHEAGGAQQTSESGYILFYESREVTDGAL
eukprot:Opistho-2@77726